MTITKIVSGVNAKLAGETLTYNQMHLFLDEVVDEINAELNATFPVFSDFPENFDYEFFPDRYIRSVVLCGAAYKFYVTDEEGILTAQQYAYDYANHLFLMKRDYSELVPEEFQAASTGAVIGPNGPAPDIFWRSW